nr:MAG TPA: hypothetical protein [Caudoviricetes sp.]
MLNRKYHSHHYCISRVRTSSDSSFEFFFAFEQYFSVIFRIF